MNGAKDLYERSRPLIIWLGLTELGWLGYWLLSGGNNSASFIGIVVAWIVTMLAWLALVIYVGLRGFFLKQSVRLSNFVGVVIVVAFACLLFTTVPGAFEGLVLAARGTSDVQLASIHIVRLAAIGAVIKYLQGRLPLHFIVLGALPDFLFAISAVVVTLAATRSVLEPAFLISWHVIGFSVFFGAGISMFFSVPSPFRIYHGKPDTSIVFQFPMFLAPNFTVPLSMIAHLFALVKLLAS